jgi:hypothetical protein
MEHSSLVFYFAVHSDPEVGDAVLKFFGHHPTSNRYQEPEFEYTGKNAVALFSDSVTAWILMTKPSHAFFGMFQQNVLRHTPHGQIDASHLFQDMDFDFLTVAMSGLALCYGNNVFGIRQVEVCRKKKGCCTNCVVCE